MNKEIFIEKWFEGQGGQIQRFGLQDLNLLLQLERERCVKIADDVIRSFEEYHELGPVTCCNKSQLLTCRKIAKAIREAKGA